MPTSFLLCWGGIRPRDSVIPESEIPEFYSGRIKFGMCPCLSERIGPFAPFDILDLQLRAFAIRLMLRILRRTEDPFATSG
jgi:hypothetical protein